MQCEQQVSDAHGNKGGGVRVQIESVHGGVIAGAEQSAAELRWGGDVVALCGVRSVRHGGFELIMRDYVAVSTVHSGGDGVVMRHICGIHTCGEE